jgi:hypothetical protein
VRYSMTTHGPLPRSSRRERLAATVKTSGPAAPAPPLIEFGDTAHPNCGPRDPPHAHLERSQEQDPAVSICPAADPAPEWG